jgi:hypothetical protein
VDGSLRSSLDVEIAALVAEESRLAAQVRAMADGLSGLKDIDLVLTLAAVKLSLALRLLGRIRQGLPPAELERAKDAAAARARGSLALVEDLLHENVSEDQKQSLAQEPLLAQVRSALEEFLAAGGGGLLDERQADERASRILSRAVVAAMRKFSGEDDLIPALDVGRLPPAVQSVLLFLFPILLREHPEQPPYGIPEGEEVTYSSKAMKLPLSQAVFYIENELLPGLRQRLEESPGDAGLQSEIRALEQRAEQYGRMRFFPRSNPVLLEQGFHTDGMTGYSADGEMLVPVPVAVSFRSGTNLDRRMELVRAELVKRIAGRGVSAEIDAEYRRLRSIESGPRGSSRLASMKLDSAAGFRTLRQGFPFLARLEDKGRFLELEAVLRAGGSGSPHRRVQELIESDAARAAARPDLRGISRIDPSTRDR